MGSVLLYQVAPVHALPKVPALAYAFPSARVKAILKVFLCLSVVATSLAQSQKELTAVMQDFVSQLAHVISDSNRRVYKHTSTPSPAESQSYLPIVHITLMLEDQPEASIGAVSSLSSFGASKSAKIFLVHPLFFMET